MDNAIEYIEILKSYIEYAKNEGFEFPLGLEFDLKNINNFIEEGEK